MSMYLKQSTAVGIMFGPFVDKADGVTLKTDATTITDIDHATTGIFLSKNGEPSVVRHQTVTASVADAYGMMHVHLDTTDTNTVGPLDVLFSKAATYLPVSKTFIVLPANVYNSLMGTDTLDVQVTGIGADVITAASIASGAIDNATFAADVGSTAIATNVIGIAAAKGVAETLNTAIPGSPTANSVNERVATMDGLLLGTIAAGTHNAQSGDSYAVVNGASGLVAIKTETALILADTGTDGVVIPQSQADKVWGTASRVLTAGTNIALAKGSGVTGFNDLSAADVRASVGLASANLDTQIGTLATGTNLATVDGIVDAIKLKTDLIPASPAAVGSAMALEASAVDAIHDEVVEGSTSLRQAIRLMMSALFGKVSGAPTGPILFRDIGDTKARITATVDLDGNRTAVTKDAT
jgi:hypothetical protein